MDYIVVARLRVSADTPEQAHDKVDYILTEQCGPPYDVQILAIEPPRAEPDLADMARRTLMAGFTS